jgi:hypothetical protein
MLEGGSLAHPSVALLTDEADGTSVLVTWEAPDSLGLGVTDIFGSWFEVADPSAEGLPKTATLNIKTGVSHGTPRVATDQANAAVSWVTDDGDILARRFSPAGSPVVPRRENQPFDTIPNSDITLFQVPVAAPMGNGGALMATRIRQLDESTTCFPEVPCGEELCTEGLCVKGGAGIAYVLVTDLANNVTEDPRMIPDASPNAEDEVRAAAPAVAARADGTALIAWGSWSTDTGSAQGHIRGRMVTAKTESETFTLEGLGEGGEGGLLFDPSVTATTDNWAVGWTELGTDSMGWVKCFEASAAGEGSFTSPVSLSDTHQSKHVRLAAVDPQATNPETSGLVAVAWWQATPDELGGAGIYTGLLNYGDDCQLLEAERVSHTFWENPGFEVDNAAPAIARLPGEGYAVAWFATDSLGATEVWVRAFGATSDTGTWEVIPLGVATKVSLTGANGLSNLSATAHHNGGALLLWDRVEGPDASGAAIVARQLDPLGVPKHLPWSANLAYPDGQSHPGALIEPIEGKLRIFWQRGGPGDLHTIISRIQE